MVSTKNAEQEILQFLELNKGKSVLNEIATIEELNSLLSDCGSSLSAALIPLEQAQRPPKILVDSGQTQTGIAWRTLQCPGGPLVLQMICQKVNLALWIQEC
ncbi:hypothetical protein ACLM45_06580 [Synechococcus sp. A10-1-5-9]|uniref:hypothetical protein n=1 Tax=Synechococcus sp. A10-1-5-9 TaxID=3392295 RepID=UPI0039E79BF2